jgi:hypothetical protein
MTIAIICLILWNLGLSFALYGVTCNVDVLEDRSRRELDLWKGQQDLNRQYDRDITRLEDRTREITR